MFYLNKKLLYTLLPPFNMDITYEIFANIFPVRYGNITCIPQFHRHAVILQDLVNFVMEIF